MGSSLNQLPVLFCYEPELTFLVQSMKSTPSIRFVFPLVMLAVALSGCTFGNKKQEALIQQQASMLEQQRTELESQSTQLAAMQTAHENILLHMQGMNDQLTLITGQIENLSAPPKSEPKANPYTTPKPSAYRADRKEAPTSIDKKVILGRVEYVWLDSAKVYMKARVDTGAFASSLDAYDVQRFERNGERWVRFNLKHNDLTIPMEAPLIRHVRIRQASAQEELDRRPVIKLKIRLGELVEETEFTLTSRDSMIYPVLLGRTFLQDIAIVDVAKKFTRKRSPDLIKEAKK